MIEQMTHVAIMAKAADRDALLRWLYTERGFHVMPIEASDDATWQGKFAALPDQTQEIDNTLTRISSVVSFCTEHASCKPGFLDTMLPLKVVGTTTELDAALTEVDVDALYDKTAAMRATIEKDNETIARLANDKAAIQQFAFLGEDLPALSRLKHLVLNVVAVSGQGGKAFLMDERITSGQILAEQLFADQTHSYYALLVPAENADVLKGLVDDHGLHIQPIPRVDRGAAAEIADLDRRINENKLALEQHLEDASRFADEWQKKAALVAGYYESEKNLAVARTGMAESEHLFVTRGYVKTEDLQKLTSRMESALPSATLMVCDAPATDAEQPEEPPVSLKWNKWISPASLLVKMYGLPAYNSIDPTPYVFTIFFAFVGICLGDAAYGIALIGIMLWLKHKYRDQAGLQDFFTCFVYCGITTVIAGTLTGSWMGDLSSMIPGLGWFDRFRTSVALIDPVKNSQMALYIAIGIGVATQFYGMILRTYRDWRRGDKMGAFSDGILWIAFLLFAILGAMFGTVFWILFVITCVLLIFTQGREQKSWISRILVGIVALYGIVGAYGASAILGDLISYARLMALNLTGAALGSTFNMLARIATDIPYIGVIVGILVIVGGHLMNFFLNLLSGFVHSARLIMLEFFGRFYEAGGTAYHPYGFHSTSVDVKNEGQSR